MLTVNHQIATIPLYVLKNYKNYITDTELLTLLHFQCATQRGQKAWEEVAANMGYQNLAPLSATIGRLEEKCMITVERKEVDATPLWTACYEGEPTSTPVKPKTSKPNPAVDIYKAIEAITDKAGVPKWYAAINRLLKQLTSEEIISYANYLDSFNSAIQQQRGYEFKQPVTVYALEKWAGQWVEKGKPTTYTGTLGRKKKDFSNL